MNDCTKQAEEYIKQLCELGYHQYQINSIIEDAVGTSKLHTLSKEQAQEVTETLAEHFKFALKCRRVR